MSLSDMDDLAAATKEVALLEAQLRVARTKRDALAARCNIRFAGQFDRIREHVLAATSWVRAKEVARDLGMKATTVNRCLFQMRKEGLIRRTRHGVYERVSP